MLMESLFDDKDVDFADIETVKAVYACKRKSTLDHFGVCSQALCFAVISSAGAWATFFSRLANDHLWLQCITVKGPLKAKASGPVLPANMRAILPQPVLLQVLHNLLCGRMREPLRARMKQIGCSNDIMGGTGGLQVMDLIQPAQLFMELALDKGSKWSAASGDIQQFYDMVPPEAIVTSMELRSFDSSLAAFAARLHVTPTVILRADQDECRILRRVRGLLTGSRSAAVIAQLPLADYFSRMPAEVWLDALPLVPGEYAKQVEPLVMLIENCWQWHADTRAGDRQGEPAWDELHAGASKLAVLVWADNIYTFATNTEGACRHMEAIALFLQKHWQLALKPRSLGGFSP